MRTLLCLFGNSGDNNISVYELCFSLNKGREGVAYNCDKVERVDSC